MLAIDAIAAGSAPEPKEGGSMRYAVAALVPGVVAGVVVHAL